MTTPQMSVPLEGMLEATREQRNQALDQAAAYKALAADLQNQLDQANTPVTGGAGSPSSATDASSK